MNICPNEFLKGVNVVIVYIDSMFGGTILTIVVSTIIFSYTKGGKSLMFLIPNIILTIFIKDVTDITKFLNGEILDWGIVPILMRF